MTGFLTVEFPRAHAAPRNPREARSLATSPRPEIVARRSVAAEGRFGCRARTDDPAQEDPPR